MAEEVVPQAHKHGDESCQGKKLMERALKAQGDENLRFYEESLVK